MTCLNHPETIPLPRPQFLEKLPFTKPVLGAKMIGDCSLRRSTDPPGKKPQSYATCCAGSWGEEGQELRSLLFILWGVATFKGLGSCHREAEGGRSRWKVFTLRRGRVEGSEQALWIPTHGDLRLDAE